MKDNIKTKNTKKKKNAKMKNARKKVKSSPWQQAFSFENTR